MTRRVWIDTDMGFDDLAAVLTVAAASGIKIEGLSLVAGNAPLDVVADNAARAAALFGWEMPIHPGRAAPLVGTLVTADYALGATAMRTAGRSLPERKVRLASKEAVDALASLLAAGGEPVEILALGPLTNIAVLLLARPTLAERIASIVWMGGSAGPGNHTAAAEFNAFVDPEAAAIVIASGIPFRMVGLDCCREVEVASADADTLRMGGQEKALLLADLLEGYVRIRSRDGSRPMSLYDPVAAVALVDPLAVSFAPAHIEVERGGNAGRGATFVEKRVPARATANAEIAVKADAARVRATVLGALANAGKSR